MTFTIEWDSREKGNKGQEGPARWFDVLGGRRRTEVKKMTIKIGDYALWWHTHLKVLVEKKEWDDLSRSLASGHLDEQLDRMAKVRETTGCTLILLVEGKRRVSHAHIDQKSLQAKLDHIMFDNRAHVIYTESVEDTVRRLYELVDNLKVDESQVPPQFAEANKVLTLAKDHGPDQMQLDCFMAVPGLSIATARVMIDQGWNTFHLLEVDEAALAEIKYPSGAVMGPARARKIYAALGTRKTWTKIIEQINGVTRKTAEAIFRAVPDMNDWTEDKLSLVQRTEKTKVGQALAARILDTLNHKKKK